ncbi:putative ATP-dependent RNA helicase DDX20 [Styela clava]
MSIPGHDFSAKERTVDVITNENVSFKDLLISHNVLSGLQKARFERPSPIQLKAIPYGRCGLDLIVQAKSGTGKTCVFTVIALEAISTDAPTLQVLILAPTREIAVQIEDVIKAVGQDVKGLKVAAFIGGRPLSEDKLNARGCHIAVGSPGRIFQLIELEILKCQNVRIFVLDEADKLLEDNFQTQINSIYSMLPENKQMIAASATYPEELAEFVTLYMRDPTFIRLDPKDMALLGVKQYYCLIDDPPDKFYSVFECKIKAVVNLLKIYPFQQTLIFSNYHSHAKDLSDACNSAGLPSTYISGNLEQERRLEAMKMLKEFKCRVLISTDLTARGIDASNVDLVVNLDVSADWETYMHRTGRAGRFGSHGAAISIVTSGAEIEELLGISKTCGFTLFSLKCESGKIIIENEQNDFTANGITKNKNISSSSDNSKLKVEKDPHLVPRLRAKNTLPKSARKTDSPNPSAVSEDVDFPRIPSLPELMNKGQESRIHQYSYKYSDILQNLKDYLNDGIFKEFERNEPTSQQTEITENEKLKEQESLSTILHHSLTLKDYSPDVSNTPVTKQQVQGRRSKNQDSEEASSDDDYDNSSISSESEREQSNSIKNKVRRKTISNNKVELESKGNSTRNNHQMDEQVDQKNGTKIKKITNSRDKKERQHVKKQKSSRKKKSHQERGDRHPTFLLPRYAGDHKFDEDMSKFHYLMQAQRQYEMSWYNYHYWKRWYDTQVMSNFANNS